MYVLEVETDIRVTNEKEQKTTMNNVYEQKKTQEVIELSNGPFT